MEKALLRISRVEEGGSDRARAYRIVVNGERWGTIKRGETKTIEVDPGEIEVYLKIDWCRSQKQRFEARPGAETRFTCRPRQSLHRDLADHHRPRQIHRVRA